MFVLAELQKELILFHIFRISNAILPYIQNIAFSNSSVIDSIKFLNARKQRLKVATILYSPFVVILSDHVPDGRFCVEGLLCNISVILNNKIEWSLCCCSGMAIEIIANINRRITGRL